MRASNVAFFGPEATFTHQAALKFFPNSRLLPEKSIQDVFRALEDGKAEFGVVPIENSTEGSVNITLDLLSDSKFCIFSETSLKIEHFLLSSEESLEKIKIVYSHPQALAQCRNWLEARLPKAELSEALSTSKAAEIASQSKGSAAISSILAAKKFGLNVLAERIQDNQSNMTKFVVVSKECHAAKAGKTFKTTLLFSVKHKPGALFDVLKALKVYNVNMARIESRPSKQTPWEYVFFVDIEGFSEEPDIRHALKELEGHCHVFRILGSYPVIE